jgi:hypothetical protein
MHTWRRLLFHTGYQPGRVALRGGAAAHRGREAVQEGENATAVIWKTLLIAEQTFRRLDAPELLAEVTEGVA